MKDSEGEQDCTNQEQKVDKKVVKRGDMRRKQMIGRRDRWARCVRRRERDEGR